MYKYSCVSCGFYTQNKTKYTKHLETKRHNKLAEISNTLADISQPKTFECEYCQKVFKHQSSLCKHVKYSCKKNKDEDMKELVRLLNEQNQSLKEEKQQMHQRVMNLEKKISKLTTKLQINNNNINNGIINNTNITLNNYGDTDISHLTDSDYKYLIKEVNEGIPKLIEKIHFNPKKPENMNVYISNMKEKYIMIYKDGSWKLHDRNDELDRMLIRKVGHLDDWLRNNNQYDKLKRCFDRLEANLCDEDKTNDIKERMKLVLYNNRGMLKGKCEDLDDDDDDDLDLDVGDNLIDISSLIDVEVD